MIAGKRRIRLCQIDIVGGAGEEGLVPGGFRLGDKGGNSLVPQKAGNGHHPVAVELYPAAFDEAGIVSKSADGNVIVPPAPGQGATFIIEE